MISFSLVGPVPLWIRFVQHKLQTVDWMGTWGVWSPGQCHGLVVASLGGFTEQLLLCGGVHRPRWRRQLVFQPNRIVSSFYSHWFEYYGQATNFMVLDELKKKLCFRTNCCHQWSIVVISDGSEAIRTPRLSFSVLLHWAQHAQKRSTEHYKLPAAFVVQASADWRSFSRLWASFMTKKSSSICSVKWAVHCTEYAAKCISHQSKHLVSQNHCLL